jgi:SPP1 gp7 family putative phage head morphogenesis protein
VPVEKAEVYKAPELDDERLKAWNDWDQKAALPSERTLTFVVARMLKAQRLRTAKRMATVLHRHGLKATGTDGVTIKAEVEDVIAEIIASPDEIDALTKDMSPALRRIIELAFKRTRDQLGVTLPFDADLSEHDTFATKMAEQIQQLTAEGVKDIVRSGLDSGATISEMQRELSNSYAFSMSRARAIARTESTQALNAGAVQAMTQAEAEGVSFRGKMWLSSRDEAVRDTHVTLDGQVVPLDGQWESSGAKADHPGGFGVAAEDINCRCTVVPVLD